MDKVSRDGEHKLVAVWQYEKRSVNDANFVYFGMRLVPPEKPEVRVLLEYADLVLNALDIKHGPSHMEVMLKSVTRTDPATDVDTVEFLPCLVEVGSRCHGGEGTWLPVAMECIGYTQVRSFMHSFSCCCYLLYQQRMTRLICT